MVVNPGSLVFLHIDTAMAAVAVKCSGTARVIVRELRARAKVLPPPGVVYEEAAPVVENRILNSRIWIPVRRTWRVRRFEHIWRYASLYRPVTRQNGPSNPDR